MLRVDIYLKVLSQGEEEVQYDKKTREDLWGRKNRRRNGMEEQDSKEDGGMLRGGVGSTRTSGRLRKSGRAEIQERTWGGEPTRGEEISLQI